MWKLGSEAIYWSCWTAAVWTIGGQDCGRLALSLLCVRCYAGGSRRAIFIGQQDRGLLKSLWLRFLHYHHQPGLKVAGVELLPASMTGAGNKQPRAGLQLVHILEQFRVLGQLL